MVFSSTIFLFAFLPAVLTGYAATPRSLRNLWLLAASLFFYAWGEGGFVLVMLASIAVNYAFGAGIGRWRGQKASAWLLAGAVAANLGLLMLYKYANFTVQNLSSLLGWVGHRPLAVDSIHLPIGISFFTFQAMCYVVDVYRGDAQAQRNPLNVALYIALFPQLIAGPIVRYRQIADELVHRAMTRTDFAAGTRRFIIGLGKKVLIADTLAVPADHIFAIPPEQLTPAVAWLGAVCYTGQILFDFAGYSDMAIGLGRMFGFHFPENFRYPYVSQSIREFWTRWHISLSTWFRDYLYIPLGGSRASTGRTYLNLVIVFFLCGLWHGASWTFVIWGLYHGTFLVIERSRAGEWLKCLWRPMRHAYALCVVIIGWVIFRAATIQDSWGFLRGMFGLVEGDAVRYHVGLYLSPELALALLAAAVGSTPFLPWIAEWRSRALSARRDTLGRGIDAALSLGATVTLILLLLISAMWLAAGTHNPFIYFRF